MEEMSVVEMLLDPDCEERVECLNEDGNIISFDQIAVIPYKDKLYAILKPVEKLEGVREDEALVFHINVEEDSIEVIYDFDLCDKIFELYYKLLKDEGLI
jgi:hypothetical protein